MAEKPLIYAVDDEEGIRELYACALESAGFEVNCFGDGASLLEAMEGRVPDLILLDIMLDGMDGYEILRGIRHNGKYASIPVIMVSAKGEEISKVKGLNLGADDYIAKPFGVLELVARIHANLRRYAPRCPSLSYKDIQIDEGQHQVQVAGHTVSLTRKEYDLLKLLVTHAPDLVARNDILSTVWGENYFGETRTLDIHIASLRKAICGSRAAIHTVRGVGYALK